MKYDRLHNQASDLNLHFDNLTVSVGELVGDNGNALTSWSLERPNPDVPSTLRIRTALDSEHSVRYLTADENGKPIAIVADGTPERKPEWVQLVQKTGDNKPTGLNVFHLADRPDLYLFAESGADRPNGVMCGPWVRDDPRFYWSIEEGLDDRSQWRHGGGQGGWAMCQHCGGLFWSGEPGSCMEGANRGRPHEAGSQRFVLPLSDPLAKGCPTWRKCKRCGVLVNAPLKPEEFESKEAILRRWVERVTTGLQMCWDGQPHEYDPLVSYTIAVEKQVSGTDDGTTVGNDAWRECKNCHTMMWVDSMGHCPVTQAKHELGDKKAVLREWKKHSPMQTVFLPQTADPFPSFTGREKKVFDAIYDGIADSADQPFLKKQLDDLGGLREAYPSLDAELLHGVLGAVRGVAKPPEIEQSSWYSVRKQLTHELDAAFNFARFQENLVELFKRVFMDEDLTLSEVEKVVESDLKPSQMKDREVNWLEFVFGLLMGATSLISLGGESIEKIAHALKALIEFVEASVNFGLEFTKEEWDSRDPFLTQESEQWRVLRKRFDQQLKYLDEVKERILSDWGRLQAVQENRLVMTQKEKESLHDAWLSIFRVGLYQQLMPYRYYLVQGVSGNNYKNSVVKPDDKGRAMWRDFAKQIDQWGFAKVMRYDDSSGLMATIRKRDGSFAWSIAPEKRKYWPSDGYLAGLDESNRLNFDALFEGTGGWGALEVAYAGYNLNPALHSACAAKKAGALLVSDWTVFWQNRKIHELK